MNRDMVRRIAAAAAMMLMLQSGGVSASPAGGAPLPAAAPSASPSVSASPAEASPPPVTYSNLTFVDALNVALHLQPTVQVAETLLAKAEALLKGAGKQPNPSAIVSLYSDGITPRRNELLIPLDLFDRPAYRRKAAKADSEARRADLGTTRLLVARTVLKSYFAYWQAIRRCRVVFLYRMLLEQMLHVADSDKAGRYTPLEKLRLRTELDRADNDLALEEGDREVAMGLLNAVMARNLETPIYLNGRLSSEPHDPYPALTSLDELMTHSLARPEILAARKNAEAARMRYEVSMRSGAPTVGLLAYGTAFWFEEPYIRRQRGEQIFVTFPQLWDWGSAHAEREGAKLEAKALEQKVKAVMLAVQTEVMTSWQSYQAADRRHGGLSAQYHTAVDAWKGVRDRFPGGGLMVDEAVNTARSARDALQLYIQAEAQFHVARINTLWTAGHAIFPEGYVPQDVPEETDDPIYRPSYKAPPVKAPEQRPTDDL